MLSSRIDANLWQTGGELIFELKNMGNVLSASSETLRNMKYEMLEIYEMGMSGKRQNPKVHDKLPDLLPKGLNGVIVWVSLDGLINADMGFENAVLGSPPDGWSEIPKSKMEN